MGRPLSLGRLVASGAEVQVDPAALELKLVELALAVVLAGGFEREDLEVAGEALQFGQQLSHCHSLRVSDGNTVREGLPATPLIHVYR
jgi:hypothetical protein